MVVARTRSMVWSALLVCIAVAFLAVAGSAEGRILDAPSRELGVDEFIITASAGTGGSIDPSGQVIVGIGSDSTFAITPDAGFHIDDVLVDGTSEGAIGSYTFTNVTADHSIAATFAIDTYTITVTAGAHGSITPGTGSVDHGSSPSYAITPDAGYHIDTLTVDGQPQTPQGTWQFTNVTADHSIAATFAIDTYTITVTAGAHGSITPAGQVTVDHGDGVTFSVLSDAGYRVGDVVVDGVSQGPLDSYTFTNVAADHTISASFVYGLETTLDLEVNASTVTYGRSAVISGTLVKRDGGTPIVGGRVALWASGRVDGPWTLVEAGTTGGDPGAEGTVALRVVPEESTFYSLRYTPAQDTDFAAATSATARVKVRPALGRPARPAAVKARRKFTVSGELAPRFPKGSTIVRVRVYRLKSGRWRPVKRIAATIADRGDASGYSVRLRLTTRGTYRFRAEFAAAGGWASAASKYSGRTRVR
jgi:hypothetical protein